MFSPVLTVFKKNFKNLLAFGFGLCYYSNVVARQRADIAQSVERILGKDEVASSNLAISSDPGGR